MKRFKFFKKPPNIEQYNTEDYQFLGISSTYYEVNTFDTFKYILLLNRYTNEIKQHSRIHDDHPLWDFNEK